MSRKFYFIAMSQKDMFKNQVLEEILRERKTYYTTKKHDIDFWILISPNFLNNPNIKEQILETNYYKQLNLEKSSAEPFSCIISMNKEFLEWVKLRLGYFENVALNKEILYKANLNNFYQSNGISGEFDDFSENSYSPLKNNNLNLDRNLLINKFSRVVENLKIS